MNNRLTILDMAGLLAEYTGKDKKETERFLRMLVSVLTDGVFADKSVKIKGLGTFKIVEIEKRESIHVNTGERFLIPEHYKFSFLPDKELKELVNKPFSFFDTVEIEENVDFSDLDQAEEENEVNKDIEEDEPEEEAPADGKLPDEKEVASETEEPGLVQPEEEAPESAAESEIEKKIEIEEALGYSYRETLQEGYIPNHHSFLKRTIILLFSFALIGIMGAYVFFDFKPFITYKYGENDTDITKDQDESFVVIEPESLDTTHHIADIPETAQTDTAAQKEEIQNDLKPIKEEVKAVQATTEKPKKDILAKVKIKAGDRLTLISLEYYGSKVFWVYLYQHNKHVISDPNNVPINTEIEVPSPELYGIDVHNRTSIDKAAAMQTQILSGEK